MRGPTRAATRWSPAGSAGRPAWGRAVRLEETDKFYQVVTCQEALPQRDSPRVGGGVAITAVHKVVQGPRSRTFQMQGQLLAAARGADGSNAKFAWYGAPLADVAAAVEHGFGRTNSRVLGHRAHGDDVHVSLLQSPYASAMLANADENGEAHIVLCRVLMGWPEAIPAGSSKLHPNSDNYDSAADNMQNPQWYVVWGKDMNMRILPEYVVSFKCPSLHQMQGSSGATSMLKKPSPVARDMFPTLLAEIQRFVPSSKLQILQGTYNRFKIGMVSGLLAYKFGSTWYSAVSISVVSGYCYLRFKI
ncbi:probable inactive poly [ADP-ribose] polymerase SRO3 isoform X2 [Aegilops tauschii subsp. strangulata]|uniref:probable inactive poly [ADP-ribose] polymerase SRO3 isoform X2 n=1 Tax=Aegilops tauschii subsp. strangulata TaxID=200361 RepID=UPI00098A36FE|nr:probable inactive poly [ADP-ribose] polymerase SRO3 isoform X2 [Aegilops tauschii subsp. strangulata]